MKKLIPIIFCLLILGCQNTNKNINEVLKSYNTYTASVKLTNVTKNEILVDYIYKNGNRSEAEGQCGVVIIKEDYRLSMIEPLMIIYTSNQETNYSIELDQIKEYIIHNSFMTKNFGTVSRFDDMILSPLNEIDLNKDLTLMKDGENKKVSIKKYINEKEIVKEIISNINYFKTNVDLLSEISIEFLLDKNNEPKLIDIKFIYDYNEYTLTLQISSINATSVELGCLNLN